MVAELVWLKGMLVVLPPLPMAPGSARVRPPDSRAMLLDAPTPLMLADPLQPEASLMRFMSPTRLVAIVTR
jgi:hypothetical protein